jgi:hypothetical protein
MKSYLMALWWPNVLRREIKETLNNCHTFSLENMEECLMAPKHLSIKNIK